ncbi:MAG: type II toxin-antitoxin system mRNA interferase toxin, RelE/StbE family [Rhodocyclaceae bacterium]|nr:type II toxin-antitoxin system mRNA interferase toxin, RelE/StbE family [Rhodocyclaceae bacterium]
MYTLVWTPRFTRAAKKFIKHHGDLGNKFAAILSDLEGDPFQPHLKYHPLGGKLKGVQAISITDSYRITLTVVVSDKEVILLDIGSHDEVYR